MANEFLVEAHGVTRRYPGVVALSDVSIAVRPGAVHVVAGENGAGKSTLVKILTGTELPSEGEIRVLGRPVGEEPGLFKRVGYVPQELNLFPHLTIAENLFMPFEQSGFDDGVHRLAPPGRRGAQAARALQHPRSSGPAGARAFRFRSAVVDDRQRLRPSRARRPYPRRADFVADGQ